ncbi:MAG TPA: glycosyltransferase family 4 protein [Methylobacter sp.]|jgi:glycosyltransferase involved in cell wall biosynthesis
MNQDNEKVRVLYSFPHKLGADRICTTAWYQVDGLLKEGAEVLVCPGALSRPLPKEATINPTLAWGKVRIPYKVLGSMRAFSLHDYIVSQRLEKLVGQIDIVHTWPLGGLRTLKTAARLGIPTVLERPNAHTRLAYEVVQKECERLGIVLPPDHEHSYKKDVLNKEEAEYELATKLLCPSDFVASSFLKHGFAREKLMRHQYGFDEQVYYPDSEPRQESTGLTMLFVGGCAPRKGVHYALEAWLKSTACRDGKFMIAGGFVPGYAEKLSSMLSHPSVHVLGHRTDVPQLMRQSDILVLSSLEEGSALVTSEARGSGCVLLVSEAAGAICEHMENALVHQVGDVSALTQHINLLQEDRKLLQRLRAKSLRRVPEITWTAAGVKLLEVYRETIATYADVKRSCDA